eukprot:403340779
MNDDKLRELMQKVEEFYFDDGEDSGEEIFNRFAAKHAHLFDDGVDAREVENKLEYTQVFKEYQELFEAKIESLIKDSGVSVEEFFEILKKKSEDDEEAKIFVQIMLSQANEISRSRVLPHQQEREERQNMSARSDGIYKKTGTQKFRDRTEMMKALKFPENGPTLVVIPSNEKGTGFLRTCYDADVLEGLLTKNEFQNVVDVAGKVVAKVYSKKRLADTAGIDNYKFWLSCLSFTLAILFLGIIYVAIDIESLFLEVSAYCAMAASMFIIVGLSIYECFRDSSKKFINFNDSVKENLDIYFAQVNQEMMSKGIEWSVQEGHYWIECKIVRDYDRMRTTPTQNFFTQEALITDYDREGNRLIQRDANSNVPQIKIYSRGSEPEKEDQLIPNKIFNDSQLNDKKNWDEYPVNQSTNKNTGPSQRRKVQQNDSQLHSDRQQLFKDEWGNNNINY